MENHTIENIITSKETRDALMNRVEVLSKVKKLILLPKTQIMTTKMVAEYYETEVGSIRSCYNRNRDELDSNGVSSDTASHLALLGETLVKKNRYMAAVTDSGVEIPLSNCTNTLFSIRAVLNVGMLLEDSPVAREVRNQLLNVWQNSDETVVVKEIDAEESFIMNIGKASVKGDKEALSLAWKDYTDYLKRHIADVEKVNESLDTTNKLLTGDIRRWGARKILNALIRALSAQAYGNNYVGCWRDFYHEVLYKHGISLNSRVEGKSSKLDTVTEQEWPLMIRTATAMCEEHNIDVARAVNVYNLNADALVED